MFGNFHTFTVIVIVATDISTTAAAASVSFVAVNVK